eukprot:COSAG02_NODE_3113_length_7338_cov_2.845559_2_plen_42_part_00
MPCEETHPHSDTGISLVGTPAQRSVAEILILGGVLAGSFGR